MWFSLTFPVCSKFPDFSLTGKCLPIFPGFPVRLGNLFYTCQSVIPFTGACVCCYPPGQTPMRSACWDTVNKRAVRILLECILVIRSNANQENDIILLPNNISELAVGYNTIKVFLFIYEINISNGMTVDCVLEQGRIQVSEFGYQP